MPFTVAQIMGVAQQSDASHPKLLSSYKNWWNKTA